MTDKDTPGHRIEFSGKLEVICDGQCRAPHSSANLGKKNLLQNRRNISPEPLWAGGISPVQLVLK